MNRFSKNKNRKLDALLRGYRRVLIAYSGGIDSSLILKKSVNVLGAENVKALMIYNELFPEQDKKRAEVFASGLGVELKIVDSGILFDEKFLSNSTERCFFCKDRVFALCREEARKQKISYICDGTNIDDAFSDRPGMKAALIFRVKHPLRICGFTKEDIRTAAKQENIEFWNVSSFSCFATRVPHGSQITLEKIEKIKKGENILRNAGVEVFRLRLDAAGQKAKIVLGKNDLENFKTTELLYECCYQLNEIGFESVAVDAVPYPFN